MNVFGPLTCSKKGNNCNPILIDTFSKFMMLFSLKDMKDATIVKVLTEQVWKLFGPPVNIVTDNATYFQSILFKNMCFNWSMKYYTSSLYFPKGNQVERFNLDWKACLIIFIDTTSLFGMKI